MTNIEKLHCQLFGDFLNPVGVYRENCEVAPDYLNKVVLLNTGSEATDACYRLIKLWAKKNNKKLSLFFRNT